MKHSSHGLCVFKIGHLEDQNFRTESSLDFGKLNFEQLLEMSATFSMNNYFYTESSE